MCVCLCVSERPTNVNVQFIENGFHSQLFECQCNSSLYSIPTNDFAFEANVSKTNSCWQLECHWVQSLSKIRSLWSFEIVRLPVLTWFNFVQMVVVDVLIGKAERRMEIFCESLGSMIQISDTHKVHTHCQKVAIFYANFFVHSKAKSLPILKLIRECGKNSS